MAGDRRPPASHGSSDDPQDEPMSPPATPYSNNSLLRRRSDGQAVPESPPPQVDSWHEPYGRLLFTRYPTARNRAGTNPVARQQTERSPSPREEKPMTELRGLVQMMENQRRARLEMSQATRNQLLARRTRLETAAPPSPHGQTETFAAPVASPPPHAQPLDTRRSSTSRPASVSRTPIQQMPTAGSSSATRAPVQSPTMPAPASSSRAASASRVPIQETPAPGPLSASRAPAQRHSSTSMGPAQDAPALGSSSAPGAASASRAESDSRAPVEEARTIRPPSTSSATVQTSMPAPSSASTAASASRTLAQNAPTTGYSTQTRASAQQTPNQDDQVSIDPAVKIIKLSANQYDGEYEEPGYGVYAGPFHIIGSVGVRDVKFLRGVSKYEIPVDDDTIQPQQAQEYMRLFAQDLHRLVERVWDDENTEHGLHENQHQLFVKHCFAILLTMSKGLVISIIKGDLPEVMAVPADACERGQARAFLNLYKEQREHPDTQLDGQKQPVIYAQFICDEHGRSPPVKHLRQIHKALENYLADDDYAYEVECQFLSQKAEKGVRMYLKKNGRKEKLRTFMASLIRRLPADDDEFRPRALAEYGYTNNDKLRLKQHAEHIKSNPIMCLVAAACKLHFPAYTLHQFTVYRCWAVEQAAFAEILLTRLGQADITSGFGMSSWVTGRSNICPITTLSSRYDIWASNVELYTPFLSQAEERKQIKISQQDAEIMRELLKITKERGIGVEQLNHRRVDKGKGRATDVEEDEEDGGAMDVDNGIE
ncbi:hypothetical protein HDK64DRAFT_313498 [Phyllosticta capitalensis]